MQPTEVEEGKEWMKVECIGSTLPRNVLHVQSISKWAPACIGPYSQAVQVSLLLIAFIIVNFIINVFYY